MRVLAEKLDPDDFAPSKPLVDEAASHSSSDNLVTPAPTGLSFERHYVACITT